VTAQEHPVRRAVVVGAEHDIGRACVQRLAADGYEVVFLAENPHDVCTELTASGGGVAKPWPGDISDAKTLNAVAASLGDAPVHALVNCHLTAEPTTVEMLTADLWERSLRVNVTGPLVATQAFLPALKCAGAAGGAAVVHLGSIDGILGNPRVVAYSAAKGALIPLTHLMAHEFASHGIRVNCIARALVSDREPADLDDYSKQIVSATPLARPAHPSEIAAAVAYLVSDEASYITGTVLTVDGGRTVITQGTP
jgi:NAD(P)-dependent dehydrogenase (short-subunit alcohol dehydrogenase family)